MRRYKFNLIEKHRTYTTMELAKRLKVHPRTVQQWSREGLPYISDSKPKLFKGEEIKNYFQNKMQKKKVSLGDDEFFCVKCKKAVTIQKRSKNIRYGKNMGEYIHCTISGICIICGSKVNKFTRIKREKAALGGGPV